MNVDPFGQMQGTSEVLPAAPQDFGGNVEDPIADQLEDAEENVEVRPLVHMQTAANFFPNANNIPMPLPPGFNGQIMQEPPEVNVPVLGLVPAPVAEAGGEQANNNNNADEVNLNESNEPVVQAVPASNPTQQ